MPHAAFGSMEVRLKSVQRFDADVAEGDRIVMACESEVATFVVLAWVWAVGHVLVHFGEIGLQDTCAIQLDSDGGTDHVDLLKIPFAHRTKETAVGRDDAVG